MNNIIASEMFSRLSVGVGAFFILTKSESSSPACVLIAFCHAMIHEMIDSF